MAIYLYIFFGFCFSCAFFASRVKTLIYFTLVVIFFPIILPFMGRDAITTGTLCIFALFIKYVMASFDDRNFIKNRLDYAVYLLIFFGLLSLSPYVLKGGLSIGHLGPALRDFFAFAGGILLFNIIRNSWTDETSASELEYHIELLISFLLVLTAIHILISLSIKLNPSIGPYFNIFLGRNAELMDFGTDMYRINTIIMGGEAFGEMLAILSPLALYKFWRNKNPLWFSCFILFCIGILLTVTRSALILFILAVFVFIATVSRKELIRVVSAAAVLIFVLVPVVYVYPSLFGEMFNRLDDAVDSYYATGDIFAALNRRFFPQVFQQVISNITLFGAGEALVKINADLYRNFHNLYMTVIYEKGILGSMVFMFVLTSPLVRLIKSYRNDLSYEAKLLTNACLISLGVFFINEFKLEFTRHASYQQICWAIFAVYYLVPTLSGKKT